MKKIFKYPINIIAYQELILPKGAQILTVQVQCDNPCIWAMVDDSVDTERVKIRTICTGEPITDKYGLVSYVGTYQLNRGHLICHIFIQK